MEGHGGKWTCNLVSQNGNKSAPVLVVVISRQTVYCEVMGTVLIWLDENLRMIETYLE